MIAALAVLAIGLAIAIYAFVTDNTLETDQDSWWIAGVFLFASLPLVMMRMWPLAAVATLAFMLLAGGALKPRSSLAHMERNFFGVHKIMDRRSGVFRVLYHGTTIHGAEQLEDGEPKPGWPEPLTYYHTQSPMAEVIRAVREAGNSTRLSPVGIVGLGAGSLACYRQEGEIWHFYEIDTDVVRIARDSGYFRFLPACAPDARIHIGDARITLADSTLKHELLLIDAFSSDAIPVHLLTKEAVQLYFDRLTPNGVLVLHISNRHLALLSEVAALANALDVKAWVKQEQERPDYGGRLLATSLVVALARNSEALGGLPTLDDWAELPTDVEMRPWTDDYSNILRAFLRNLRGEE